jgi:agmatinase
MNNDFDPNGIRVKNGNIFGLPYDEEDAEIIVIPVPWDVTSSYGKGAAKGPRAILEASSQIDYFHPLVKAPWKVKMSLSKISIDWEQINEELSAQSIEYINYLERGHKILSAHQENILIDINEACFVLKERVKEKAISYINQGKKVGLLGGDHSTALSLIEALSTKYKNFGVLQIDAHANLRKAYQGFTYSHASVFFNVLQLPQIQSLVQVGIRDVCEEEVQLINKDNRIHTFYQHELSNAKFDGKIWKSICEDIINKLPTNVYVSFDVGGLLPMYCPNTSKPVPGGLEFEEVKYLLHLLKSSGKNIIGFDLCEVAPNEDDDWDANVGARLLWQLMLMLK